MFIKVHAYTGTGTFSGGCEFTEPMQRYINVDAIAQVIPKPYNETEIALIDDTRLRAVEPIDEIMKIITYFKVGNDK